MGLQRGGFLGVKERGGQAHEKMSASMHVARFTAVVPMARGTCRCRGDPWAHRPPGVRPVAEATATRAAYCRAVRQLHAPVALESSKFAFDTAPVMQLTD